MAMDIKVQAFLPLIMLSLIVLIKNASGIETEVWQRVCPFNDFCTVNSTSTLNATVSDTLSPCCSECSCEQDCFLFETCCPDVVHKPPEDIEKASCTHLLFGNSSFDIQVATYYRVIDFCPRGYDVFEQQLVDRCAGKFVTDLKDVVAVYDSRDIIYKNRYCALCHGVTDVLDWDLLFDGFDMKDQTIPASRYLTYILTSDNLLSAPQNEGQFQSRLCGQSVISKCTNIDYLKESIAGYTDYRDKCLNGPYLLFRHISTFGTLYIFKNKFCFLCYLGQTSDGLCPLSSGDNKKGFSTSLELLLDLSLNSRIAQDGRLQTEHRCEESNIFDQIKEACRPLYCPPYHVVSFGRCLPIQASFTNILVYLRLVFKPKQKSLIYGEVIPNDKDDANKYAIKAMRSYGLHICKVTSFVLDAVREIQTGVLVYTEMSFLILIDDMCDLQFISNKARTTLSKIHDNTVTINNEEIEQAGQINFYPTFPENPNHDTSNLIYLMVRGGVKQYDGVTSFYLCPYFIVDIHQYGAIVREVYGRERNLTEISKTTQLEEGFYALEDDTIAVCVDTYFGLYSRSSADKVLLDVLSLLSLPFVMAVYH